MIMEMARLWPRLGVLGLYWEVVMLERVVMFVIGAASGYWELRDWWVWRYEEERERPGTGVLYWKGERVRKWKDNGGLGW